MKHFVFYLTNRRCVQGLLILCLLCTGSCQKNWLEAKRDLNTVLPTTLDDLYALLHIDSNPSISNDYIGALLVSSDDHYCTDERLQSIGEQEFALYTRTTTSFPSSLSIQEWNNSYEQVFYANVVLEKVQQINRNNTNAVLWDNVKGGGLFFRAKAFYNIAQTFAQPYQRGHSESDQGIPLRLSSDPNIPSSRASLEETYQQITSDLKLAAALLTTRPDMSITASRQAALGLLARIYLAMRIYEQAGLYADSCLQLHDALLDYNHIADGTTSSFPIARLNAEVIFHAYLLPSSNVVSATSGFTDPQLLASYAAGDRRGSLFFRSTTTGFRGNYTGSSLKFGGIATDEMLLIRAECAARSGDASGSLDDLNRLLRHRYTPETFHLYSGLSGEKLLNLVIQERRKELLHRGLRWGDLRRLNLEQGHEVPLLRIVNDTRYELPPNDPRYALPIPDAVIFATGMPQNDYSAIQP
ncbi:SusD family protein [bacterium A37T11]|nr:SusD family protein [bacterium A37T11]